MMILKSKLYREEIKHWLLIVALFLWAMSSTIVVFRNSSKTILVGMDESGARIISESTDRLLRLETKQFLKFFLDHYYTYDQVIFAEQMGLSTELMSPDLWEKEKSKLIELKAKLDKNPLSQTADIENMDLVDQNKVEAILKIKITSRMNEQIVRLKVIIEFKKQERNDKNPWNYQITELSDVVL